MADNRKDIDKNSYRIYNEAREKLNCLIVPHNYTNEVSLAAAPSFDPIAVKIARHINTRVHNLPGVKPLISNIKNRRHKIKKNITLSNVGQIVIPVYDKKPQVSIVIPAFNKYELTLNCINSIITNVSKEVSYEIVLMDNGSTDDTHKLISIKNLNYVQSNDNLGFVEGCNTAAKASRGEFIVFLNNDALVTPGWLESLLNTLKSNKNIGIVGSKIVYPNGLLQEAGGIIFSDGSGWNYGKNNDPNDYKYNYVREVDYCSGASIIISRDLFNKCGGFDMLYAPAYYEDTDLCFKVRSLGYKVMYQPTSVIYHIEGATAGTNLSSGYKKYQAINRVKFINKWKNELKKQTKPNDVHKARDRSGSKLALIIDEYAPTPNRDSGSVRMTRIIEILKDLGYKVSFLPAYENEYTDSIKSMESNGIEVIHGSYNINDIGTAHGKDYDLVIMSRPKPAATYLEIVQAYFTNAKIIYDTVDLHYLRTARQAKIEPAKSRELNKLSAQYEILEKGLLERVDASFVVSSTELSLLRDAGVKSNISVVSNIHELNDEAYSKSFDKRKDLLFVGNYIHTPNVDAVKWLAEEIFPAIKSKNPNIKLHIVGPNLDLKISNELLEVEGVINHGFVDDLTSLLQSTRIFVAPLRYGAGVKGKIGQAIEFGIPVVTTDIGAEGMSLLNKQSVLVANSAKDFSDAVTSLYADKNQWLLIQSGAKSVLNETFSTKAAAKALKDIV